MQTCPFLIALWIGALAAPLGAPFDFERTELALLAEECFREWPPLATA